MSLTHNIYNTRKYFMEPLRKLTDVNLLAPYIEESLKNNCDVRITVTGYSMYPLLRNRKDSVILGKPPKKLKKYDIVFYKREDGSYILHRILKIKDNLLSMAGDNEIELEYPIKPEQIIGVTTHYIKSGKKYSTKNLIYKLYVIIWAWLFPHRHKLMPKLIMLNQKIKRMIKR